MELCIICLGHEVTPVVAVMNQDDFSPDRFGQMAQLGNTGVDTASKQLAVMKDDFQAKFTVKLRQHLGIKTGIRSK
jgi:hypothetical protein